MAFDHESRVADELLLDLLDTARLELNDYAARTADEGMKMPRPAGDIPMLATGIVDPLEQAKLFKECDGAIHR